MQSENGREWPLVAVLFFLISVESAHSADQTGSGIVVSTLLGGKGDDRAGSIRVASDGSIYIGGTTEYSNDFPTLNAIQAEHPAGKSGIVAKFKPDGMLEWATYLGGSKGLGQNPATVVTGLATDNADGVLVAGITSSQDFPTLSAKQSVAKGTWESFLSKIDKSGKFVWSTYIGGYAIQNVVGISADNAGAIYVAAQSGTLCVVAKFDGSGSIVWRKEFGDEGRINSVQSIALDGAGNIYIGGKTGSRVLPRQVNTPQYAKGTIFNPFVAKFDPNGQVLWSAMLGGSDNDGIVGIAADRKGMVYVVGNTKSKEFPTLRANQPDRPGRDDAFVAKFDSSGLLLWSTYLGATGNDGAHAIAVDPVGNIHVTGYTASVRFPILRAFQAQKTGMVNAFVTTFSPEGTLVRSSYLGGTGQDFAFAITTDIASNVYLAGFAGSRDFPLMSPYQDTIGGFNDIFLTKISSLN